MITLLALILTIVIIVIVHESGHFTFAKIFGVKVERFSVGFPPVILKTKKGDTEYVLGLTPLGGYVKMAGMLDESLDSSKLTGAPNEFMSKNYFQKLFILSGGALFNFIFAILMFTAIFTIMGKTILPGTEIAGVDTTGSAYKIGFQKDDKIISINNERVKSWDQVNATFLKNLGKDIEFDVKRGNDRVILTFSGEQFSKEKAEYLGFVPKISTKIGEVMPNFPASKAGIIKGDSIVSINNFPITSWQQMTDSIRQRPNKKLEVEIIRKDSLVKLSLTPKETVESTKNSENKKVGKIGVTFYTEHMKYSLFSSFALAVKEFQTQAMMQIKGFSWLITGKKKASEMLGGPIAIAQMAGQAASYGIVALLKFIALISIILGIINLLPLPVLDGGHIVIVSIEAMIRKPLPDKIKIQIQKIGMVLFLAIMLFAIFNDLTR